VDGPPLPAEPQFRPLERQPRLSAHIAERDTGPLTTAINNARRGARISHSQGRRHAHQVEARRRLPPTRSNKRGTMAISRNHGDASARVVERWIRQADPLETESTNSASTPTACATTPMTESSLTSRLSEVKTGDV
jgi:hypothetical protein